MEIKNKLLLQILAYQVLFFSGCKDMNDLHSPYLENGEINYVARPDSVKVYGGNGRVKFDCYISDIRVENFSITWQQGLTYTTIVVPLAQDKPTEQGLFSFVLGDGNRRIREDNHVFTFISDNGKGVKSIPFNVIGDVYGSNYELTIIGRKTERFSVIDDGVEMEFDPPVNDQDIGVEIMYRSRDGQEQKDEYTVEELETPIAVTNLDFSHAISYRTLYLPEENAIDTFYTAAVTPSGTVTSTVVGSSDDAEEGINGSNPGNINLGSNDLEFGEIEGGVRGVEKIGLRFNDIAIPNGATIISASIQFTVHETVGTPAPVVMTIYGEDTDNSLTFESTNMNISNRLLTTASVDWDIPVWATVGEADSNQKTADIKDVIQEIINRAGWTSSNSISIIFEPTVATLMNPEESGRVAESFDGVASAAPVITINWEL